jgi:flagellar hook protein FlgE
VKHFAWVLFFSFGCLFSKVSADQVVDSHRPFDVAIRGHGFYVVQSTEGEYYYTRLGSFIPNVQMGGALTTRNGYLLQAYAIDEAGKVSSALSAIQLPTEVPRWIEIKRNGVISELQRDGTERDLYQIPLAIFERELELKEVHTADRIYEETLESGVAHIGNPRTTERGWLKWYSIEAQDAALLQALPKMNQGALELSQRSTDLAIEGRGFFILSDRLDGRRLYSRDGSFYLDEHGRLTDHQFNILQGFSIDEAGRIDGNLSEIKLDRHDLTDLQKTEINISGRIVGYFADGSAREIYAIPLATFVHPEGLKNFEDYSRTYVESGESGEATIGLANTGARGRVRAFALEMNP